jgi:hypothetical protein
VELGIPSVTNDDKNVSGILMEESLLMANVSVLISELFFLSLLLISVPWLLVALSLLNWLVSVKRVVPLTVSKKSES